MTAAQGGTLQCKEDALVHDRCTYRELTNMTVTWDFHLDYGCLMLTSARDVDVHIEGLCAETYLIGSSAAFSWLLRSPLNSRSSVLREIPLCILSILCFAQRWSLALRYPTCSLDSPPITSITYPGLWFKENCPPCTASLLRYTFMQVVLRDSEAIVLLMFPHIHA